MTEASTSPVGPEPGPLARVMGVFFSPTKTFESIARKPGWDWLVGKASKAGHSFELLEQVGLVAKKNEGNGYYDRFRERVIFPIRDMRGLTVGFGGRVLPGSASEERGPKYYTSTETMLRMPRVASDIQMNSSRRGRSSRCRAQ